MSEDGGAARIVSEHKQSARICTDCPTTDECLKHGCRRNPPSRSHKDHEGLSQAYLSQIYLEVSRRPNFRPAVRDRHCSPCTSAIPESCAKTCPYTAAFHADGSGSSPAAPSNGGVLALIERMAIDPRSDPGKLERMVALWERTEGSRARREFAEAMNRAQSEIAPVARQVQNSEIKSHWFARLEHVDAAIRPIYIKHGFSLMDNTVPPLQEGYIRLECLCSHTGGHFERFYREGPPDNVGPKGGSTKTLIHGIGSTETFLRRYMHCGIFNVVFERQDTDGTSGPIDEKDANDLIERMDRGKVNSAKFLRYMRLPSNLGEIIATLPKSELGKALLALDELEKG